MDLIKANRHELKYSITNLECLVLKNRLNKVLKKDSNCKNQEYIITSLYFDDFNNSAYSQKLNGEPIRHKYRIRYYDNDTSFLKLEKKSKIQQMTRKVSAKITQEEVKSIYNSNYTFLKEKKDAIFKDFYMKLSHDLIKPKVIVKYSRLAFVHPVGNLRITFDSNVSTSFNQINIFDKDIVYTPALDNNKVILEIKFNSVLPDYIKSLIQTGNVMTSSSSKYVFSRKYNYEF